jgi:hypothetical protein
VWGSSVPTQCVGRSGAKRRRCGGWVVSGEVLGVNGGWFNKGNESLFGDRSEEERGRGVWIY